MATAKAEGEGKVSQDILDYYEDKSKGGHIALIIIEHSFVSVEGKAHNNQLSIADDSVIEGLKKLSDIIHKNGSKAVMQINHAGSATTRDVTGCDPVGPSAVAHLRNTDVIPRELTITEIQRIIDSFADAAARVKKAGFDGVEIHSAHGYLLSQFFSPISNKRTDEYGGDVLNRIRIHLRVIEAVRKAVGEDFTVMLRLGASDYMEGGTTIEDSVIAAREFEKAGIAALDISGGFCGFTRPDADEQGYFWPLTKAIKEQVSIPVILTGGITDSGAAEQLLADGKTDLIGVGRAILKDSDWAKRAMGI
jgi:NADH:flavin oxidoreductases, Old Yellow Enzyme family